MDKLPRGLDREATDGLGSEEMAELLIGYAQENEALACEVERLQRQVAGLTRSAGDRLQYIRGVRAAEAAVKRFVTDPAIAPYLPDLDETWHQLFGDPIEYRGGGGHDQQ